jgi:hypothetical protein
MSLAAQPLKVIALACAAHGDPVRFSTSVLGGTTRDDLELISSTVTTLHQPEQQVEQAIFEIHGALAKTLELINNGSPLTGKDDIRIPFVLGWERGRNMQPLFKLIDAMSRKLGVKQMVEAKDPFTQSLANLLMHQAGDNSLPGRVEIYNRVFAPLKQDQIGRAIDYYTQSPMQHLNLIMSDDLQLARAGDQEALARLREIARALAESCAQWYLKQGLDGSTRFLQIAPNREPFNNMPVCTFPAYFDLRHVAAKEIRQVWKARQNIFVKGASEAPSPPFVDVARTLLWDLFDIFEAKKK